MRITPAVVREEYAWLTEREDVIVPLINETRDHLGEVFGVTVDHVSPDQYQRVLDTVFADGDRAVNVATLVRMLRDLDVEDDYPGFVVDELLGRELAAIIAGNQPHRLLAEATFHVADVRTHGDESDAAGADDLDAAVAAGVQTTLPGWSWTEGESPFSVDVP